MSMVLKGIIVLRGVANFVEDQMMPDGKTSSNNKMFISSLVHHKSLLLIQ